MEKIYEPINFVDNSPPFIDAENLNKMDSAIDELDNRLVGQTPVNNLLATVEGKPLDAVQGKALGDKIDKLGGFEPIIDESGKIIGYKTEIGGAGTVFPFSGGGNTALLVLEVASLTTSYASPATVFGNEDYFDTTNGNVCTTPCSGKIYIRYRIPQSSNTDKGEVTFEITINGEVIYSLTSASNGYDTVEFSCNVGDSVSLRGKASQTEYGRAPVVAVFVGN